MFHIVCLKLGEVNNNMKKIILLVLLLGLLLVGCDDSGTNTQVDSTENDEWNVNEMMNNPDAMGQYSEKNNVNRYPEDELYDLIVAKIAALNVHETYVEDFEQEDLYKRFYPITIDEGASFSYETDPVYNIDGTSLCLKSEGDYNGIVFGGMKFAKNSTYKVRFDYKIVTASNDFFFQFRSSAGGVETDIYETITGNSGDTGTFEKVFFLGDHTDYQVMLFPRDNEGAIVIDNVEFTRLNSKPRIISCNFTGELSVGSTVGYDYIYYDFEGEEEKSIEIKWYVSLDRNGKNKELIAENADFISITEDMRGKYLAVSIRPTSGSDDDFAKGDVFTYYTETVIGGEEVSVGSTIHLDYNEEFMEDFEQDTNVSGNIYFHDDDTTHSYITTQNPLSGEHSLYISSTGAYSAVKFDGIDFQANGIYEVSFDYKFLSKGENLYIQMHSDSTDYSHDKFVNIDMSQVEVNQTYQFKTQFALDGFSDYYLMLFPSNTGCELFIDNLKVTRVEGANIEIVNKELQVGESIEDNFDDYASLKFGFDYSQTPNSAFTKDEQLAIEGQSLIFESDGNFKSLYINKGLAYTPNAKYKVEFDYKIISWVDTAYFQLNNGSNIVFKQFGSAQEMGKVCQFNAAFTIDETANYIMQIFPGSSEGTTKIVIDNFKITRIE